MYCCHGNKRKFPSGHLNIINSIFHFEYTVQKYGYAKTGLKLKKKIKLRGFSPQANYTDLVTAACRRS
jgi:hypothetical protein